jgi:hypothetical protein
MRQPKDRSYLVGVDQVLSPHIRRHAIRVGTCCDIYGDVLSKKQNSGPGGARTPRGLAGTY